MRTRAEFYTAQLSHLIKNIRYFTPLYLLFSRMKVFHRKQKHARETFSAANLSRAFIIPDFQHRSRQEIFLFFIFFLPSHIRACVCFFISKIYNRNITNVSLHVKEMRVRSEKENMMRREERERGRPRLICKWKGTEIEFYVRIELAIFFSRV